MLRLTCTLSVVLLALFAGAAYRHASAAPDADEFIKAEVVIGKEIKVLHKFSVPVVRPGERKFIDDKAAGEGWESVDGCSPDVGCSGSILIVADRVTDDSSKMVVTLEYKDRKRCDDSKEMSVVRGETTEFKMKCGAKVKAFYAPQQRPSN